MERAAAGSRSGVGGGICPLGGGEELYMPKNLEAAVVEQQETHRGGIRKRRPYNGLLNKPVPENWEQMESDEETDVPFGGLHIEGALHIRDRICAVEIWAECFGGDLKFMKRFDSMEINNILLHGKWQRISTPRNFESYGQQRGFARPAT